MANTPRFDIRIEHNRLFIDDLARERVVLQHNAHQGERPYIHLLRSADGPCMTEDSPWHHPWQHGIQTCFVGVNGSDFWHFPGLRPGHAVGAIQASRIQAASADPPGWSIDAVWRHTDGSEVLDDHQEWSL